MAININELGESIGSQFRDLNGLHPGLWPLVPRLAAAVGVFILGVVGGYFLYWSDQIDQIDVAHTNELKLRDEFKVKVQQAVSLDALKEQRKLVQQYVNTMEKQLPSQAEWAALLQDINNAASGRGLQFELFEPGQPNVKDYYAELPISIKLSGNYHDLGQFVADIAKLSRIVTLNNLQIKAEKDNLLLEVTAKTFRYLNPEEVAEQAKAKQKDKGAKK